MYVGLRWFPRVFVWSGHPDYCWRDIYNRTVTVTWKA